MIMKNAMLTLLASACLAGMTPVQAGNWTTIRSLEGPFATSSIPEPPLTAMNGNGHALVAWNVTGIVHYAERLKGGAWQPSRSIPGGGTGAGPVAVTIGNNEAAAVAYTTVATRYTPSKLMISLRPAGGTFGTAVEPVPGLKAGYLDLKLGIACDGGVTLVWGDATGIWVTSLEGNGGTGACDGQPGTGAWSGPVLLSNSDAGAGLPDLVVNDAGAALVVWQEGAPGNPTSIGAAYRAAGGAWEPPQTVSVPTGLATWNPKPGLDAAGNAAVGYLDGYSMVVARRPVGGAWDAPVLISGAQAVYYPAFAMSAKGDMLAAWLSLDPSNVGAVWSKVAPAGGTWGSATRLSARTEAADWPTAAYAADGSVALVGWTDDASNTARAAVLTAASWKRTNFGTGYWGGRVSVAAGGGAAVAGWALPILPNPNSAKLVASTWQ